MASATSDMNEAEQLIKKVIFDRAIGRAIEISHLLLSFNGKEDHYIKCYQTFGKRPDIRFCIDRGSDCCGTKIMTNFLVVEPDFELMGLYVSNPGKYAYLKPDQRRWRISSTDTSALLMSQIHSHILESYCIKLNSLGLYPRAYLDLTGRGIPAKECIMVANCRSAVSTTEFTNRGTGGSVHLSVYGRPGTFGLALAEKIAASGLNESEYVHIAQQYKKSTTRFKDYIRYYIDQGFNLVLENGRYVDKTSYSEGIRTMHNNDERLSKATVQSHVTDDYDDIKI